MDGVHSSKQVKPQCYTRVKLILQCWRANKRKQIPNNYSTARLLDNILIKYRMSLVSVCFVGTKHSSDIVLAIWHIPFTSKRYTLAFFLYIQYYGVILYSMWLLLAQSAHQHVTAGYLCEWMINKTTWNMPRSVGQGRTSLSSQRTVPQSSKAVACLSFPFTKCIWKCKFLLRKNKLNQYDLQ